MLISIRKTNLCSQEANVISLPSGTAVSDATNYFTLGLHTQLTQACYCLLDRGMLISVRKINLCSQEANVISLPSGTAVSDATKLLYLGVTYTAHTGQLLFS